MVEAIIRKVGPEDAYEYAANHIACWKAAYTGIISDEYLSNMSVEQMADRNLAALTDQSAIRYYCMEYDGKMIGRLVFGAGRDEDKPGAAEIAAMYLLDSFWYKGYGRQMMEFSVCELQYMCYSEVFLWVLEANDRAKRFYEKCGFVFDGAAREYNIDTPQRIVRYTRSLEALHLG